MAGRKKLDGPRPDIEPSDTGSPLGAGGSRRGAIKNSDSSMVGVSSERRRPARAPLARPETVPAELVGKFVAWSADGLKILGSGDSSKEALAAAGGGADLILERIPSANRLRSISGFPEDNRP